MLYTSEQAALLPQRSAGWLRRQAAYSLVLIALKVPEPTSKRSVLGRPAPHPADEHRRLRPEFVEWLQAFPDGYTHLPGLSRATRLRLLGGSVNQLHGALALRLVHDLEP